MAFDGVFMLQAACRVFRDPASLGLGPAFLDARHLAQDDAHTSGHLVQVVAAEMHTRRLGADVVAFDLDEGVLLDCDLDAGAPNRVTLKEASDPRGVSAAPADMVVVDIVAGLDARREGVDEFRHKREAYEARLLPVHPGHVSIHLESLGTVITTEDHRRLRRPQRYPNGLKARTKVPAHARGAKLQFTKRCRRERRLLKTETTVHAALEHTLLRFTSWRVPWAEPSRFGLAAGKFFMSTERKLLRAITTMEAETGETAVNLSRITSESGLSPTQLREQLTELFRKGYITSEGQTTDAGRRVAARPLGQVLLRRQPRRQREPQREAQAFTRSTKIPLPIIDASVIRASRNTSAPVANDDWLPPTMNDPQPDPSPWSHSAKFAESFVDVRESELEELKPY